MPETPTILRQFAQFRIEDGRRPGLAGELRQYLGESDGPAGPQPEVERDRWSALIMAAERHGLAPLLLVHLDSLDVVIPGPVRHQLLSLTVRHRRANAARIEATEDIVAAFDDRGIDHALLKGIALSSALYPEPALRPMSDIDILVPPDRAPEAQQTLREIGYTAESRNTGYLANHHHLPMAARTLNGVGIAIEIHHDALSNDVAASITFDHLTTPLKPITVGDTKTWSLGSVDTLRHLCHHLLEPVTEIKLGAIADLYGYAEQYRQDIDFALLDARFPFVRNLFRLLHHVTPLPDSLRDWAPPSDQPAPEGTGFGYPPMTATMAQSGTRSSRIRRLFRAPDWWLHGYYQVPPEGSIRLARSIYHPLRVLGWLGRRTWARWRPGSSARSSSTRADYPRG